MSDFPDYEAAIRAGQKAAVNNGGDYSYAIEVREIVDAALGDEPLYRSEPDVMMYTKGKFVQVWSKEES